MENALMIVLGPKTIKKHGSEKVEIEDVSKRNLFLCTLVNSTCKLVALRSYEQFWRSLGYRKGPKVPPPTTIQKYHKEYKKVEIENFSKINYFFLYTSHLYMWIRNSKIIWAALKESRPQGEPKSGPPNPSKNIKKNLKR